MAPDVSEATSVTDTESTNAEISTPAEHLSWNVAEVINEVYLRTVSRFPTADERQTAQSYIADSDDPVDGLRGVSCYRRRDNAGELKQTGLDLFESGVL